MKKNQTIRVLSKGGILTPSHLKRIIAIARIAGSRHVHFGSRQDLLFDVRTEKMEEVASAFKKMHCEFVLHGDSEKRSQNIVSSYVSADIMSATSWLTSGNYLYVLEHFHFQPKLRVNITDAQQSIVPLMFGQLNFIASEIPHYWYLYLRRSSAELPERWPVMVLSDDISTLSYTLENNWFYFSKGSVSDWFSFIQERLEYNHRKVETSPVFEYKNCHDYEGFGQMHSSRNYWAGFYWRNNEYEIDFLEEFCNLCSLTGISKICITPWKSFLVKEIGEKDLIHWDKLLGKFGINMRHSSFDMNWHLPIKNALALRLKRSIVKAFDNIDVCVYGLTFGIKGKTDYPFYSIQIERISGINLFNKIDLFAKYKISYAKDFNPSTCQYIEYTPGVPVYKISQELRNLSLQFYEEFYRIREEATIPPHEQETTTASTVYQCTNCLTIYDESIGDSAHDITPGTKFASLPVSYCCPLCEAEKSTFEIVSLERVISDSQK